MVFYSFFLLKSFLPGFYLSLVHFPPLPQQPNQPVYNQHDFKLSNCFECIHQSSILYAGEHGNKNLKETNSITPLVSCGICVSSTGCAVHTVPPHVSNIRHCNKLATTWGADGSSDSCDLAWMQMVGRRGNGSFSGWMLSITYSKWWKLHSLN